MKIFRTGFAVLALIGAAHAADDVKVVVTGNRVSLRAAPELNSVLLDRAMKGDSLVLVDGSNAEWLGVFPPESVDLWVHREFIQDGKVIPNRLNIRSGPSLNHSVVGVVEGDQELTVRGEAGGWLRIAPPNGTVVWISRQYAEIPGEVKAPVVMITAVEPDPEPATAPGFSSEINPVMISVNSAVELPAKLVSDSDKKQGVQEEFSGILLPAGGLLYKLVTPDVEKITVCYVRGNAEQMQTLAGRRLTIIGRTYWALDVDRPVVVPVKIRSSK